jgi:hypothetical protein
MGKVLLALPFAIGCCFATGVAHADNLGPYAGDTVNQLQAWGYNVMFNGVQKDAGYLSDREKSDCLVTGIHPSVSGPAESGSSQTLYVDLSCAASDNSNTSPGS